MKVTVKGSLRDMLAFRGLAGKRRKRFAKSPATPLPPHPVNVLAENLHPARQDLVIASVRDETASARTYRLRPAAGPGNGGLAYFRAGQYLSVKAEVGGVAVARPYSISSAPSESLGGDGFYELTIRRKDNGFLTQHIWETWAKGTPVTTSGPCGFFYHEPMRDGKELIGLAGGSGITPFRSMARELVHGSLDASLTLFYGSDDEGDIIFFEELKELEGASAGRLKVVHVLSCDEVTLAGCEQGFITAETISRHADVDASSFFICGPQAMYRFVAGELTAFNLPPRRVRREAFGELDDIREDQAYPGDATEGPFRLRVHIGGLTTDVPARAGETVLVAMERAGLAPPSQCRSGECGFCRSLLIAGEVHVRPETDGRRAADKQYGYIHPCASYPLSDLEVRTPRAV
jgi:ferredoxin-NADP reductase